MARTGVGITGGWAGLAGAAAWLPGTVAIVVATAMVQPDGAERAVDGLAYLIVGCACVAVAAARRWPVPAAVLVTAALLGYVTGNYPDGPILLAGLLVLFTLGLVRGARAGYGFAVGMASVVVAANAAVDGGPGVVDLAFVGWSAAAVFAADAVRGVREKRAARQERARLRAEARDREEQRRLAEQRLRIARDLHDSVAHAMATINVQAGMAGQVIDSRPDLAKEALEVVRAVSGTVLDELNALVRVLRTGEQVPLRPSPGLADLPDLVRSVRQSGTRVELSVAVPEGVVPEPVGLAVYRIVQESLTNVTRHAPGARAHVTVSWTGAGGLRVTVDDDGTGVPGVGPSGGVGITGMRERAAATGGSLRAGRRPDGGFTVVGSWPTAAPVPVEAPR